MLEGMFFDKYGRHGGIFFDTSTYSFMSSTYATWPIHVATKFCTFLQIKWLQCVMSHYKQFTYEK
jgi:hypothetical protein